MQAAHMHRVSQSTVSNRVNMQAAHMHRVSQLTVSNRVNMQAAHMHGVSEQLSLAAGPYRRRLQLLKVSLQKFLTVVDKFTAFVS
jgi:hypothetical protein